MKIYSVLHHNLFCTERIMSPCDISNHTASTVDHFLVKTEINDNLFIDGVSLTRVKVSISVVDRDDDAYLARELSDIICTNV